MTASAPPVPDSDAQVAAPPAPDTPCDHCGLPVGTTPVYNAEAFADEEADPPVFCCTGCQAVYHTLRSTGMDDTYYRLAGVGQERQPQPAQQPADDLVYAELGTDDFLKEHAPVRSDGTRALTLFVDGVHCAACVWLVERLTDAFDGITEARLNLPRAQLHLVWREGTVALPDVADWLAQFGYRVHPMRSDQNEARTNEERRLLLKVGICWALAGNVMLLAFALYAGLDAVDSTMNTAAHWVSMALAIPSVLYGGSEFVRRAWSSIRWAWQQGTARHLHMDVPIALGIWVGFLDSVWGTVSGRGEVWFDSITVLIAAVLTARWLQLRSRRLAGDASDRLLALLPTMAHQVHNDGTVEAVRVDTLESGDEVRVRPGDAFPVDGVVVEGRSSVNNAVLTGEHEPTPVSPGDEVTGGATNLSTPLTVRVTATGEASSMGQLLAWVREEAPTTARVAHIADRLTGYFVAGVATLAVVTATLWLLWAPEEASRHVVALLVITCPCALGMATPLALAVATGQAAQRGIFVKSEHTLEQATRVDTIVLDKTGTLTEGTMALLDTEGDAGAVRLAASLEAESTHPIARALTEAYPASQRTNLATAEVHETAGRGITGCVDGHRVTVGRPNWVMGRASCNDTLRTAVDEAAAQGHTPVAVAIDDEIRAVCTFGDRLRAEVPDLVQRWRQAGHRVLILSGDHPDVVQHVARQLDLPEDDARGHVSPAEKREAVEALHREDRTVAMVGDGVNDAGALQQADIGIAVDGGATPSLVAADVFLTQQGLTPLNELFEGGTHVLRVIKGTLLFSLLYNLAGGAIAMAGWVGPLVAAVAMPVSSLVVVSAAIMQQSFPSDEQLETPRPDSASSSPDAAAACPRPARMR